ncbi:MAG: class I SAM-dependent methyltransferase [Alphaproteobacteria bacterium]
MVSTATAQANTLAAYDAIAPLYEKYSEKYRNYLNAVDALVIERLRPGMRLLDVGSGDGRRLKKITTHHGIKDVVSVEPSLNMAEICRKSTGFDVYTLCGDQIGTLNEAPFDAVTALWNVFGHMADSGVRLATLQAIARKMKPDAIMILDVNNRHNQLAYGRWNVMKRRVVDALAFDETRGDAYYDWEIEGQCFPASGHLFTPAEMQKLFRQAGLEVIERRSVNYATGKISDSLLNGQLFFVLKKA